MNENQNEYVDINAHDNYPDSEQTIETPPMKVIPLKKICMTIGELPTAYLETMSYYEMLVWFIEYLKNNIIPTINNNANAIQEVQSVVLALQNYINDYKDSIDSDVEELEEYMNNYFENLDVQEEINNKLDDMLEDGVLEQIIEQFLQLTSLICFDNVADMKASTNLANGSYAKTLGYYSVNDGGSSIYKVRTITNLDVVDNATIIALYDNTLVAEIVSPETLNIVQMGALTNGTSVLTALQNANKTSSNTIYFPSGTYLLDGTITISKNLKGQNATINMNRNNGDEFGMVITGNKHTIENLTFHAISSNKYMEIIDSNNISILNCRFTSETNRTSGGLLDLYSNNHNTLIENCYFETHTTGSGGIWIRQYETDGLSSNILFNNCEFIGDTTDETIAMWGWRGTIDNVLVTNSKITRPLNTNITNAFPITIGQAGITKNCGFDNCIFDIHQATSSIIRGGITGDTNLFVRNSVITTHMESLTNGVGVTLSGTEGIEISNCIINQVNTTGNAQLSNGLLTRFINCTINCATQIHVEWGIFDNCIFNNNPSSTRSTKIARSLYAKNCVFNGINNTGTQFIACNNANDSIKIEGCKFNYVAMPYRFIVASAYSDTLPFILKGNMYRGEVNATSANIAKGYVCDNYVNYNNLGTLSDNLASENNTIDFAYQ